MFLYGGKTDQYNAFGYDSAPWNNDLLFLSLSTAFDPSVPPWQYVSGSQNTSISSQGPTLAWHTVSAFNSSYSLIFGGSTGPLSTALPDNSDSAELLNVLNPIQPLFITYPEGWAGEPQRRMRHATASINGSLYIIGGEAADGSGNLFSTHYLFIPSTPIFIELPSENAPPGIMGHAAIILLDGRLLVFGGISQGQLISFSECWVLDTTQSNLIWTLASIDQSSLPSPRSSFAYVLLDDGRVLIQGGTDATFQAAFVDGWILDPSKNPMTWTLVPALSQLGGRKDHFAINAGGQVVFGFGAPSHSSLRPLFFIMKVSHRLRDQCTRRRRAARLRRWRGNVPTYIFVYDGPPGFHHSSAEPFSDHHKRSSSPVDWSLRHGPKRSQRQPPFISIKHGHRWGWK